MPRETDVLLGCGRSIPHWLLILHLQALSIYQNRHFITVYHGEQEGPNDFDTVLLKALVAGMQE